MSLRHGLHLPRTTHRRDFPVSTCISREGEYSDHVPGGEDFVCGRCGAFAEDAAVAEVLHLREVEQALLDDLGEARATSQSAVEVANRESARADLAGAFADIVKAERDTAEGRSERWRLLAMGWKHRCYTAGDTLTAIAILHMQRPCSHGSEPHEPKRAPNGEVWCSGPHCRACGVVAPCGTYLLATRSGRADRP